MDGAPREHPLRSNKHALDDRGFTNGGFHTAGPPPLSASRFAQRTGEESDGETIELTREHSERALDEAGPRSESDGEGVDHLGTVVPAED